MTLGEQLPDRLLDTDDAGFEPLLIISGTIAMAYLIRAISRIVRDHRDGGVVIDARDKSRLSIRQRVRGVDAGTVIVMNADGAQILQASHEDDLRKLLLK